MAATEEILGQFLGDESFPVDWASDAEQDFFWVYDDLHIPHPVSPMFFDIGGWWLCCDHMFRRFGTPFAVDWLAKNVNGYVYTTAIPADPDLRIEGTEYSSRYGARVPRDADYASTMGAYLDVVLPVYGQHFADWWHDRLVPEMQRNFAYLEERLDAADAMSLAETATLLEDAIDVHDRHWKIHWMLNFAQLSATLDLRAVMERVRGIGRRGAAGPAPELRVGSQLGLDRGAVGDEERGPRRPGAAGGVRAGAPSRTSRPTCRPPSAAAASWPSGWSRTSASSAGTPSGATSSSSRRCASRWSRSSSWSAATSPRDYDFPSAIDAMRRDIEAASEEILAGLKGEALEEMSAANATNLRMAPLTPDHHFYIDQGANAHLRLVLLAVGRKLVEAGRLDAARRRAVPALRRAARAHRQCLGARCPGDRGRAPGRAGGGLQGQATRLGRHGDAVAAGLPVPRQLGLPRAVPSGGVHRRRGHPRHRGLAGHRSRGSPGSSDTVDDFDDVRDGDLLVCQMTNPAWVVLFTRIAGLVTDTGGTTSHPAVLSREFGIPAVVGTSDATHRIATGDRIRIDGGTGVVEVLERAGAGGPGPDPAAEPASAIGR